MIVSLILDLNFLWIVIGVVFIVIGSGGVMRKILVKDFFIGYCRVDLKGDEIFISVFMLFMK